MSIWSQEIPVLQMFTALHLYILVKSQNCGDFTVMFALNAETHQFGPFKNLGLT